MSKMSLTKKDLIDAVFKEGLTPSQSGFPSFCQAWVDANLPEEDSSSRVKLASNFVKAVKGKWTGKANYFQDRLVADKYFEAPFVKTRAPPKPSVKGMKGFLVLCISFTSELDKVMGDE